MENGFQQRFYLDYPNEEVRHSFLTYLLAGFTKKDEFEIRPEAVALRDALIEEKPATFIQHLQSFIADIPSRLHLKKEAYYHSLVYMVFRLVGMQLLLEKETDKGRIDAVLELPNKVYIIELKFATDKRTKRVATLAQKALKQISEKNLPGGTLRFRLILSLRSSNGTHRIQMKHCTSSRTCPDG